MSYEYLMMTAKSNTFTVRWSMPDRSFIGRCNNYPSLAAHGSTVEEAWEEIRALVWLTEDDLREEGSPVMSAPGYVPCGRQLRRTSRKMEQKIHRAMTRAELASIYARAVKNVETLCSRPSDPDFKIQGKAPKGRPAWTISEPSTVTGHELVPIPTGDTRPRKVRRAEARQKFKEAQRAERAAKNTPTV